MDVLSDPEDTRSKHGFCDVWATDDNAWLDDLRLGAENPRCFLLTLWHEVALGVLGESDAMVLNSLPGKAKLFLTISAGETRDPFFERNGWGVMAIEEEVCPLSAEHFFDVLPPPGKRTAF